jgi:hypothetical protein
MISDPYIGDISQLFSGRRMIRAQDARRGGRRVIPAAVAILHPDRLAYRLSGQFLKAFFKCHPGLRLLAEPRLKAGDWSERSDRDLARRYSTPTGRVARASEHTVAAKPMTIRSGSAGLRPSRRHFRSRHGRLTVSVTRQVSAKRICRFSPRERTGLRPGCSGCRTSRML